MDSSLPKGWQLDLARLGRLAPSTVAQVKRGTGVGAKTMTGFAKAFGFKSPDELRSAAYKWWETEGRLAAAHVANPGNGAPTPVMSEAVEAVLALYPASTRERLEGILEAFSHQRFAGRDRAWWIQMLLSELRVDEDAELEARRARVRRSSSTPPSRSARKRS